MKTSKADSEADYSKRSYCNTRMWSGWREASLDMCRILGVAGVSGPASLNYAKDAVEQAVPAAS